MPTTKSAARAPKTLSNFFKSPFLWPGLFSLVSNACRLIVERLQLSAPHRALLIQPFVDSVPILLKFQGVFWRVGNFIEVVILDEKQSFGVFGITQELFQFVTVVVHKIFFYRIGGGLPLAFWKHIGAIHRFDVQRIIRWNDLPLSKHVDNLRKLPRTAGYRCV